MAAARSRPLPLGKRIKSQAAVLRRKFKRAMPRSETTNGLPPESRARARTA
jgi:hypothetical protein